MADQTRPNMTLEDAFRMMHEERKQHMQEMECMRQRYEARLTVMKQDLDNRISFFTTTPPIITP